MTIRKIIRKPRRKNFRNPLRKPIQTLNPKSRRLADQVYGEEDIKAEDHKNLPRVAMENKCLEYVVDSMHDSGKIDVFHVTQAPSVTSGHAPIMIAIIHRTNRPVLEFEVLAVAETVRRPLVSYYARFRLNGRVISVLVKNGLYSWWFGGEVSDIECYWPVKIVGSSFSKHEGLVTVNDEHYLLELHYNLSANAYFLQVPTDLFEAEKEYCFTTESGMELRIVDGVSVDMELGNDGKANSSVTVVKF